MVKRTTEGMPAAAQRAGTKTAAPRAVATRTAATPWGPARVVDEVTVAQRAGEKEFATVVQLLDGGKGAAIVRIAYSTDGVARRGPVTLREADLGRLRKALRGHEALANALGLGGAA
jgi:hypothetical protein